jgi:hypothetical protein
VPNVAQKNEEASLLSVQYHTSKPSPAIGGDSENRLARVLQSSVFTREEAREWGAGRGD